ncbi:MAG TPA: hypothetical protein VFJ58_04550 [Armatimonadota bacterium]|nr:hypothetical protein [Armatimonadota bacterium]
MNTEHILSKIRHYGIYTVSELVIHEFFPDPLPDNSYQRAIEIFAHTLERREPPERPSTGEQIKRFCEKHDLTAIYDIYRTNVTFVPRTRGKAVS